MHKVRGDGVAGIKRRRRDVSSGGVRNFVMTSGHGRLKEDIESSTWRQRANHARLEQTSGVDLQSRPMEQTSRADLQSRPLKLTSGANLSARQVIAVLLDGYGILVLSE
ncbi:hypothetical protein Tco_0367632 [Tanacetum coccineum]